MAQGLVYSEGFRDGHLQKFSRKGTFVKTHEGELALQGIGGSQKTKQGQVGIGEVWSFSVVDPEVSKQLETIPPGKAIRLYYKEFYYTPSWVAKTNYRVYKVSE